MLSACNENMKQTSYILFMLIHQDSSK